MNTEENIKNADLPVAPLVNDNGHPFHASQVCFGNTPLTMGLTKREHFTAVALQGLLSNSEMGDSALWDSAEEWIAQITESAKEFADAQLKELEK